ncbi:HK97 gp10 family phage protein [Mycolicibacterium sp. XJ662]
MARVRVKQNRQQIENLLADKLRDEGRPAIAAANRELAEDARRYWRAVAPVDEGDYRDSIHVRPRHDHNRLPATKVVATDWKSSFIEFGTGGESPTPEFAPRGQTQIHFGGGL